MKLIKNCVLIDGVSPEPLPDAMVVFDGQIQYTGPIDPALEEKFAPFDVVIDAEGRTVMPGMIDAHVHLTMDGAPDNFRNLIMDTVGYAAIQGAERARRDLEAGFTTIRCCGEKGEIDFDIRNAIRDGLIIGPRVLASGKAITITGGHGDMYPAGIDVDGIGEIADGVDAVTRLARKRIKRRADNIKVMATGGGMSPGPATVSQLNVEEMKAAVREAEKNGICTAAHAIGEEGCMNAVVAGIRTIEHGTFLNDETIALMAEKGTYLVTTLTAFNTLKYGPEAGVPKEQFDKVTEFAKAHYNGLRKAIKAGVKVCCGTDMGTAFSYHGENAYELECLVKQGGMTPMQAIIAATSVTAEALMQDDIGTLKEGMTADLLLIDGDPLSDITILQDHAKILHVYRNGDLLVDRM